MIDKNILIDAINTYGEESQIEILIEELAELIFAIQKLKRNYEGNQEKKIKYI